jgi:hypothetical protein
MSAPDDSPELAALRLWASHRLDGEALALVRMVDELTAAPGAPRQ